MSSREQILQRMRAAAQPTAPAAPWNRSEPFTDLARTFGGKVVEAGGEVLHATDHADAQRQLLEFLNAETDGTLVYNPEGFAAEFFSDLAAERALAPSAASSPDSWIATCERAAAGVTGVDAAFAQTGTVILSSGSTSSRLVSLLPPIHIAVVYTDQILSDIIEWVGQGFSAEAANTVLVSGPSKSADIEQTLTIGVHGPKRFVVLLIESAQP
jgi:L-lactate dehydrogenase complex protein LldG